MYFIKWFMEYLIIEICILIIIFSIHKFSKIKLFENKLQLIVIFASTLIIGSVWDNYAVWRGHWFYPGEGTLGIFLGYIPLEDYIFIIVVTYAILVGYKFYEKYSGKNIV